MSNRLLSIKSSNVALYFHRMSDLRLDLLENSLLFISFMSVVWDSHPTRIEL